jgi:hypothetical protein
LPVSISFSKTYFSDSASIDTRIWGKCLLLSIELFQNDWLAPE